MEDDGWDTRARRARRHARVLLQRITLPDPFDLDEFLQVVAADRGRPIKVRPLAGEQLPTVPCGLWIAGETVDWVFVENSTSPLHREHIVLHEVAHMICGHTTGINHPSVLLPHLDPARVRMVLGRTSYSDDQEREAEALASLLLSRAHRTRPSRTVIVDDALGRAVGVLGRALR